MRPVSALLCLAALGGCAGARDDFRPAESYGALGSRPGWLLTIAKARLSFVSSRDNRRIEIPRPIPQATATGRRFAGEGISIDIVNRPCNDDRSGIAFADTVTVAIGGATYRGCGGERVPLLDS